MSFDVADPSIAPAQNFEDFYAQNWIWAFRLAALLTRSTEAGEDIAQDALAAMARRWGSYEVPTAYLRASVVNGSRSWHRRHQMARSKLPLLTSVPLSAPHAGDLADAVARLPFRQRAVIVLRYWSDLSERDIAVALNCRPGTVKSLASRALETLAKEIEQ